VKRSIVSVYLVGGFLLSVVASACDNSRQQSLSPTAPSATPSESLSLGPSKSFSSLSVPVNFRAHLSGDQVVPPRDTRAQGQAIFQLSPDGTELSYRVIASNIENVIGAHIHIGATGVNGPNVFFLFGPGVPAGGGRTDGVLATGTIAAATYPPFPCSLMT
jgi:hypothetical protein